MEILTHFDQAASARLMPAVKEFIKAHIEKDQINCSAAHMWAKKYKAKIDNFRENLLDYFDLYDEFDLIFTGSATEANSIVAFNFAQQNIFAPKEDHPSLAKHANVSDSTEADLYMLSHVNSTSGVINTIPETTGHIHIDMSQSFMKITHKDITNIHSITLSSHKMGGPKGAAALLYRKGCITQSLFKGGNQETELRSSTLNEMAILGWQCAFENFKKNTETIDNIIELKQWLSQEFEEITFPFKNYNLSPYILFILIPGISSDIMMRHLEQKGIITSSSSACSSKVKGENQTLKAYNIDEKYHKTGLRLSFSPLNTKDEFVHFKSNFKEIYQYLQALK